MMSGNRILVIGATGQQGGAVVEALLQGDFDVNALTRNPDSDRARELAARGVGLIRGDMDERDALAEAFRGFDGLFLMSTPFEAGMERETAQGINAVDAASAAGIGHLVFTSVADADRSTGIPHFDSKQRIEEQLKASGVPYTILAPAYFYENMMAPFVLPGLQDGVFAMAMPADHPLQMVSVRNIGELAALAFGDPDRFLGRRINLAGDDLNGAGYAAALGAASGRTIGYFAVPIDQVREMSEDMALMYEWFVADGYDVDIAGLTREYPEVAWESFQEWAGRQDWSVLDKS